MSPNPERGAPDGPLLLPPQLARSEDWTWAARQGADVPSPYSDPSYLSVFTDLARALHRRQSPHAVVVGDRGVGKGALLAEFARRAAVGEYPFLDSKRFLAIDTRFVPPDEARGRLVGILNALAPLPELVAVWDGLPTLLSGAGGASGKHLLMAALASIRCRLVVLATPREYEDGFADDPDLLESWSRIDVAEPDARAVRPLLDHYAHGLEEKYRVAIPPETVATALATSANYILNDQLPAKALKVLIRACERVDFRRAGEPDAPAVVGTGEVFEVISELTAVPVSTLAGQADRTDYESALGRIVFGQDRAVAEVAQELGLIKAGLTDPGRPATVMLFLGQTGTGKTELAKALARFYSASKRLKTYTLGNCVEAHSVSTIIGVPPGYVGSERGGRITTDLNTDPYSVFLLDEADKAHPDVLQPFLNLFDEGWVTDQRGTKGYAHKAIFVLTTNVGQRMIADMARDGKGDEEIATRMKEALSQIRHSKSDRPVFTPEFLARIKRVIVFRPLDRAAMVSIARKHFDELERDWRGRRGKLLRWPVELADHIGEAAHQRDQKSGGKEGGRVVRKLVSDWVESPLQRAMAADPEGYKGCSCVEIRWDAPGPATPEVPREAPALDIRHLGDAPDREPTERTG